ncbi:cache domain-containing protein [uncultured Cohaesibacter sp.]|uniref:cache domain-containing protein n=1 Tax=uncultured Cohaesibacter sp. TaxID=1002546 RepID=UPI0029302536|nr:cache domain-containing protein [uncultured Cohaesibacter sp.]
MLSNLISAMPAWMKGLSAKIYFLVFLAVVGIGAITLQASLNSKSDLEASKAEELHHLVQTALSVIETFDEQAKAGQISEQEAKTRAMSLLSRMRYNDTDYFWINDMNRIMLMHGTDPSNVGKDFTEITDPNGTYVFQELVRIGQQENGGMLRYEWPHPQSRQPVMKMSYVQSYKDWGWIVEPEHILTSFRPICKQG